MSEQMTEQERDEMIQLTYGMVNDIHTILVVGGACITVLAVVGAVIRVCWMVLK
jgi:hypothetical protein